MDGDSETYDLTDEAEDPAACQLAEVDASLAEVSFPRLLYQRA